MSKRRPAQVTDDVDEQISKRAQELREKFKPKPKSEQATGTSPMIKVIGLSLILAIALFGAGTLFSDDNLINNSGNTNSDDHDHDHDSLDPIADGKPYVVNPDISFSGTEITIYRSPDCNCCHEWMNYMGEMGASFEDRSIDLVSSRDFFHEQYGIDGMHQSCHSSEIGGYFVEGHIPAEAIQKLLTEQPAIDGIAMGGMPAGSPGMGGDQVENFVIYGYLDGISTGVFMTIAP